MVLLALAFVGADLASYLAAGRVESVNVDVGVPVTDGSYQLAQLAGSQALTGRPDDAVARNSTGNRPRSERARLIQARRSRRACQV